MFTPMVLFSETSTKTDNDCTGQSLQVKHGVHMHSTPITTLASTWCCCLLVRTARWPESSDNMLPTAGEQSKLAAWP